MMTSLRSRTILRKRTQQGTQIGVPKLNDHLVKGRMRETMRETMALQPRETAPAEVSPRSPSTFITQIMVSPPKDPLQSNQTAINKKVLTPATGSQMKVYIHKSLQKIPRNLHSVEVALYLKTPTRVKKRPATSQILEIREVHRTRDMAIAKATQEKPQDLACLQMTVKTFLITKMTNKNK